MAFSPPAPSPHPLRCFFATGLGTTQLTGVAVRKYIERRKPRKLILADKRLANVVVNIVPSVRPRSSRSTSEA